MSRIYAATEPRQWRPFAPRPILPADPPSSGLHNPPALSTYRPPSNFGRDYTRSTHIFVSAWPRATPFIPIPAEAHAPAGESREERNARDKRLTETLITLKSQQEAGNLAGDRDSVIWICINRYARKSAVVGEGKTVICTHANGMHKELFEPLLHRLFTLREDIEDVWVLDCMQHGDSALLNEANLGMVFDWSDLARDVLCFMQHYLPSSSGQPLSKTLQRVPADLARTRLERGHENRKMIALGHSFGGCAMTLAVRACPSLFDALVLVDPLILPSELDPDVFGFLRAFISGAVVRRIEWKSRQDADEAFKASPFAAWSDEVFDLYMRYGLVDTPCGTVRLKCTGLHEAAVFIEAYGAFEAWTALPDIDERIAIHWILPPTEQSMTHTEEIAAARVYRRPAHSTHVVLEDGSHLLVQSHPAETAEELDRFLRRWEAGTSTNGGDHSKARL